MATACILRPGIHSGKRCVGPVPPMPTPRHGLGAVVVDNLIWLVGGARKPSGVDTSDAVEAFGLIG